MTATIADWKQLEPRKHYTLSCKCQGYVVALREDGFVMLYTHGIVCGGSLETSYLDGYGPYTNYFDGFLATDAMPAEPSEPPDWWPAVLKANESIRKKYKRHVE